MSKEKAPAGSKESKASLADDQPVKLKGKGIYLLLAAIVAACVIVFHDFIIFKKVYLFKDIGGDSINIYFPWLIHMSDYIKSNGIPSWTFSQGMGQNLFPLWLGDFFSDMLILLSKNTIPYALAYIEIIKIIFCGLFFYLYLCRLKVSEYAAVIVSFLFAFCGYIILGGCWTIFSVEALYIALILYGFESWLIAGRYFWFVTGLTCMALLQPFLLLPYAIFLAVYIPVRYNDERPESWRNFPMFLLKTAGLAVVAVAISSWQLFPDLLQYIESPRVGGEAQLFSRLKTQPLFGVADDLLRFTSTFRFFGSDMLGTGYAFKGWQNYMEAPLFYCGIFCLVAFPQAFTGMHKSQKIAYGIMAGVFSLPIFFPWFRHLFWAFTGDYFRTFSLVITLLLLIYTAKGLNQVLKTGRVNLVVLGATVAFLLFLLFTPARQFAEDINTHLRSVAALLIFVYAILLLGLSRQGSLKNICRVALAIVCFAELVYFSTQTIGNRDVVTSSELHQKVGYNDYTVDAVSYIKSTDKSFYRIIKDYNSGPAFAMSVNDAQVQGYFGTGSYHSFNQINYIRFLAAMDFIDPKDEGATRVVIGLLHSSLVFSIAAGKYWLAKHDHMEDAGFDSIAKFGDVKVYRNKNALPLGFVYHTALGAATFKSLSTPQKYLYLFQGCVVRDSDADLMSVGQQFNVADTPKQFSLDVCGQMVSKLRGDTLSIIRFKETDIKGAVSLSTPGILFFSIPLDKGWHATVNGAPTKIYDVDCGLMGLKLPAGKIDVELSFTPRLMKAGGIVSCLAIVVFIALLVIGSRRAGSLLYHTSD